MVDVSMEEINFFGQQSDSFLCGISPVENPQESLLSDLNLGLSLGSIYDDNFKERPFTRSFTGSITLNRDTVELGSMLSLEMYGSIPSKGEQEQGRKSRRGISGEEKSSEVTLRMVASAEKNPALHRALAQIKAAEGWKIRDTKRNRASSMGETSRVISFSPKTNDEHAEILLHGSSEKTKETQLSSQVQLEHFDFNLARCLSGINDNNFKEKPLGQSSSVSSLIDLNKDSDELSNILSWARSCSILMEGEQDRRGTIRPRHFQIVPQNNLEKQRSGADKFGKEKVYLPTSGPPPSLLSRIAPLADSSVDDNLALRRALSMIKEADGCVYSKKLRRGMDSYVSMLSSSQNS